MELESAVSKLKQITMNNKFENATYFCAGVTSRRHEILFRGFSHCENSWIFFTYLGAISDYIYKFRMQYVYLSEQVEFFQFYYVLILGKTVCSRHWQTRKSNPRLVQLDNIYKNIQTLHLAVLLSPVFCVLCYSSNHRQAATPLSSVPEIIDPVFTKTSPKRSFCMTENERCGLVFVKTGSINSGTVLYGIISERRSVLAAQLLLREKSGGQRVDTDSNIPSLPGGSMIFMIFIWWKLKMSYHTFYPSWDGPSVVCYLFLYLFICAPTIAFT